MIATIIIAAVLVIYLIAAYNGLVRRRNHADNAFATIDVMLKKRYDLIPNLVQTVKQYAEHEAGVLSEVVKLRNRAYSELTTDEKVKMDYDIRSVQRSFNVMVEQYPDLKASANFLHLQGSLNETEEQLAAARRTYNASVTDYNNSVQTFPSNLMASAAGFKTRLLLETPAEERANVNVKDLFK
ncbi:LemA family protein [Bacteroides helcogenes]|uniref:LemA family protein n=1 Tax=Bacteroides helcogenes (strain ATCC 35417 / DSM 20613 / JCM 6297 / CCUG 15421 / P 36-108) TaxID=693979 RepID=E6SNB9_BACT6|nr:LemA family protein [Bacteroides helcogenes]ADV42712.1 LemA family protein [Bacteroides helcogenes P 36-108]MDY5239543.1 LemA family protein [Bacteroides helcogenes]